MEVQGGGEAAWPCCSACPCGSSLDKVTALPHVYLFVYCSPYPSPLVLLTSFPRLVCWTRWLRVLPPASCLTSPLAPCSPGQLRQCWDTWTSCCRCQVRRGVVGLGLGGFFWDSVCVCVSYSFLLCLSAILCHCFTHPPLTTHPALPDVFSCPPSPHPAPSSPKIHTQAPSCCGVASP